MSSNTSNCSSYFDARHRDGEIKALFFLDKTRRDSEDRRRSDLRFLDLERGEISDILSKIPPDVYNGFSVVTCGNHAYAIGGKMIYRSTDHVFALILSTLNVGGEKLLLCYSFRSRILVHFRRDRSLYAYYYNDKSWVCLDPKFPYWSRTVGIAGNVLYVFYEFCDETFWKAYDVQDKKWLPLKWLTEFSCTSGCSSDSFG
ncbi:hypothetical protein PVK06_018831 [Gossypium arboreum]|uniref:Uncharacterized protein n=1 Tax=Gossypium arboreum TaxID=29729 RepID=A0ABR0PIC3_GOSAR|nr:hypothetical protein PVK06_018831 [Gossypium arboreum]